jgi:hypothetical protein
LKERDHFWYILEQKNAIRIKYNFKKQNGRISTGFIWLRIEYIAGML